MKLAQFNEQEPVAWIVHDRVAPDRLTFVEVKESLQTEVTPLYTTPPQRKPLTDERIREIWKHWPHQVISGAIKATSFARAIESAHGIKE